MLKSNDFVTVLFYKELGQNPYDLQLFGTFHVSEAVFRSDRHLEDRSVEFVKVDVTKHTEFGLDPKHKYPFYGLYTNGGALVKHIHFKLEEEEPLNDSAGRLLGTLVELSAPAVTEFYRWDEIKEALN